VQGFCEKNKMEKDYAVDPNIDGISFRFSTFR
jgi:hypothetical protein